MKPQNDEFLQVFGTELDLWSPSEKAHARPGVVLANKVVMIYFSAQWCGPCTRFTPVLKELYHKLKSQPELEEEFELVFCSLDKVQGAYDRYIEDMPWWCLPYDNGGVFGKLANLYANGQLAIPLLVVIDKDGSLIVQDGVGAVALDPQGRNFPWRPKKICDMVPKGYISDESGMRERHPMSELDDKYLLLYFSAHWCKPCQTFTPKLVEAYQALKEIRSDFEVIFISSDREEETFEEYFGTMPFGAFAYDERPKGLSKRLQVRGIPTLVMLGPKKDPETGDRPVINRYVRGIVEDGDYISQFPYFPKRYADLNRVTDDINTHRCVIIFVEGCDDDEQEDIQEALQMACFNCQDKAMRFLWAIEHTGLSKTVREALQLGPITDVPVMVLLDIPDQGSFYLSEQPPDISLDSILRFVKNPGERRRL